MASRPDDVPTDTLQMQEKLGATDPRDQTPAEQSVVDPSPFKPSWRFYCLFGSLCLISLISAINATIVTTALPTITREIGGQQDYVWIANSFLIASTAPQPLFGQISNIFGRRNPMLASILLFALGSGIAGGATNPAMLTAGRTVQGLGSGGLFVLLDVIVCDLVPLRERGKYLGVILSTAAIGTLIGPITGGSLAQINWRWVFYLNLPIAGLALFLLSLFLNVKYRRSPTWLQALARVDFVGSLIFIPSVIALLLGLILGGVAFPWSSYQIIVPLVLGVLGWTAFHFYEASRFCAEPSMPPRLFLNRTSAVGFAMAFISNMLLEWDIYFLPVYFQAVLGVAPFDSGVDFLPYTVIVVPFGILAGAVMSKTGLFRPLHGAAFTLIAIGSGLLSVLDSSSSKVAWVCFQIITAAGIGVILTTVLPSTLASLAEADVAVATASYSFIRSIAFVWGVTIPSIIFNGQINRNLYLIGDEAVRSELANGAAYGLASGDFIPMLDPQTRQEVREVYASALATLWQVSIAFACLGFVGVFVEKHVELRKSLNTDFGLDEGEQIPKSNEPVSEVQGSGSLEART